jgi:hypothetical protein
MSAAGPSATRIAVPFVRHPAGRGVVWLKESWVMLSAARVQWLLLLLTYYLIQIAVSLIPIAGPLALMILRPVFTVGFLAAAWNQERGGIPQIQHLFRGFRANLWALIPIGLFLVVGTALAIFATVAVDGGELFEGIASNRSLEDVLSGKDVEAAMLFASACAVPIALAAWFAPALVVFNGCGAVQALGTSLRAAVVNWRPAVVYGVLLVFFGAVVPAIAVKLIAVSLPLVAARVVVALTVVPYMFLFIAAQAISDYVSYRDIFHADEGPAPPPEPETGAA